MTRSEEIRNVINSPSFYEIINEMKKELTESIINSNDNETELREHAYIRIKAVNQIIARLESIANDDKVKDSAWKIL